MAPSNGLKGRPSCGVVNLECTLLIKGWRNKVHMFKQASPPGQALPAARGAHSQAVDAAI